MSLIIKVNSQIYTQSLIKGASICTFRAWGHRQPSYSSPQKPVTEVLKHSLKNCKTSIFCMEKLFYNPYLDNLMRCLLTNKNLLSEFSNGEGSVLLVAPRDQRGKTRHEEVKPLQVRGGVKKNCFFFTFGQKPGGVLGQSKNPYEKILSFF